MKMPRFIRKLKKRRNRDRPSRLSALTKQITRPFRQLWQWISEARQKRSYRNLWLGIPAGVLGIAALALAMVAKLKADETLPTYRQLATKHYEAGDLSEARTYLERIYRSGDTSDDVRYFLAETLQAQGETARAQALYESLAPDDGYGYPEAHLLKATGILASRFRPGDELLAHHHLTAAQARFGDTPNWLFLRAKLFLMLNDHESALPLLRSAARKDPRLLYDLAIVCKTLEERDKHSGSEVELEAAKNQFQDFVKADAKDTTARLRLGELLTALGRFDEAREVLKVGFVENRKLFGPAVAQVFLADHDNLLRAGSSPFERLQRLKYAVRSDPRCVEAVRRLAFFGEEPGTTEKTRNEAKEYLENMVATGQEAAIAHLALGSKAWTDKKPKEAITHLTSAYDLDPSMSVLANNLAWVLSHSEKPELENALAVINTVLENHPDVAAYRDTRGQILVKMQRWDDALKDLQFALREMPDSPEIHHALSLTYRNLTPPMTSLAAKHAHLKGLIERRRGFGRP